MCSSEAVDACSAKVLSLREVLCIQMELTLVKQDKNDPEEAVNVICYCWLCVGGGNFPDFVPAVVDLLVGSMAIYGMLLLRL